MPRKSRSRQRYASVSDKALLTLLDFAGADVPRALVAEVLSRREKMVPALIRRATDLSRWQSADVRRVFGSLHALNLLGAMETEQAVEPLLAFLTREPGIDLLNDDLPAVLGHIGPATIEPALELLRGGADPQVKAQTLPALLSVCAKHPETREFVCDQLRRLLQQCGDRDLIGEYSYALAQLRDRESAVVIRDAFARVGMDPDSEETDNVLSLFASECPDVQDEWELTRDPLAHFDSLNLEELEEVLEETIRSQSADAQNGLLDEALMEELKRSVAEGDPSIIEFFGDNPELVATGLQLMRSLPCTCNSGKQFDECCGRNMPLPGEDVVASQEDVALLPGTDDTWQLAARELEAWYENDEGVPTRAHLVLCAQAGQGYLLGVDIPSEAPGPPECVRVLMKSCVRPMVGEPRRPAVLQVDATDLLAELVTISDRLGIAIELVPSLPDVDLAVADMQETMGEHDAPPGILRTPGVTEAAVRRAFDAAAEFYRKAPWRRIGDDLPIEIRSDLAPDGSCVAVIMGHGGLNYGLALFDTLENLETVYNGAADPDSERLESARVLNVSFDAIDYLPPDDHHDLVAHKWPVAGRQAYPVFMRVEPESTWRRPLCHELELLEATMRALPVFVKRHVRHGKLEAPADEKVTVETVGGTRALTLVCPPRGFLDSD